MRKNAKRHRFGAFLSGKVMLKQFWRDFFESFGAGLTGFYLRNWGFFWFEGIVYLVV